MVNDDSGAEDCRLDVWLDIACLFRTRSEAQRACKSGKITVNDQSAKQNRLLRTGEVIRIKRPFGRSQQIIVRRLATTHVPKAEARLLYEDVTPVPTPEEAAMRRLDRIHRAAMTPPHAPDKRERRQLRRLQGKS
jgi:ribosome-associated heat shock protein Hsp15